jgi:hypothetical protein
MSKSNRKQSVFTRTILVAAAVAGMTGGAMAQQVTGTQGSPGDDHHRRPLPAESAATVRR